MKLSSGVALGRENIGGGPFKEPDTGVGASAAPRLSFGGQQELNTLVQVDGVDNVQTFTGLPRATPSQEAVKEFRILNSTYLAEYGRALGGFVNIVTKSGHQRDARLRLLLRHERRARLAARSSTRPGTDTARASTSTAATLGGPLAKDRTFFFAELRGPAALGVEPLLAASSSTTWPPSTPCAPASTCGPRPSTRCSTNDYNAVPGEARPPAPATRLTLSARYSFLDSEALQLPWRRRRARPRPRSAARDNATRDHAAVLDARHRRSRPAS